MSDETLKNFITKNTARITADMLTRLSGLKAQSQNPNESIIKLTSQTTGILPNGNQVNVIIQGKVNGNIVPGVKISDDTYLVIGKYITPIQYDGYISANVLFQVFGNDPTLNLNRAITRLNDPTIYNYSISDIYAPSLPPPGVFTSGTLLTPNGKHLTAYGLGESFSSPNFYTAYTGYIPNFVLNTQASSVTGTPVSNSFVIDANSVGGHPNLNSQVNLIFGNTSVTVTYNNRITNYSNTIIVGPVHDYYFVVSNDTNGLPLIDFIAGFEVSSGRTDQITLKNITWDDTVFLYTPSIDILDVAYIWTDPISHNSYSGFLEQDANGNVAFIQNVNPATTTPIIVFFGSVFQPSDFVSPWGLNATPSTTVTGQNYGTLSILSLQDTPDLTYTLTGSALKEGYINDPARSGGPSAIGPYGPFLDVTSTYSVHLWEFSNAYNSGVYPGTTYEGYHEELLYDTVFLPAYKGTSGGTANLFDDIILPSTAGDHGISSPYLTHPALTPLPSSQLIMFSDKMFLYDPKHGGSNTGIIPVASGEMAWNFIDSYTINGVGVDRTQNPPTVTADQWVYNPDILNDNYALGQLYGTWIRKKHVVGPYTAGLFFPYYATVF